MEAAGGTSAAAAWTRADADPRRPRPALGRGGVRFAGAEPGRRRIPTAGAPCGPVGWSRRGEAAAEAGRTWRPRLPGRPLRGGLAGLLAELPDGVPGEGAAGSLEGGSSGRVQRTAAAGRSRKAKNEELPETWCMQRQQDDERYSKGSRRTALDRAEGVEELMAERSEPAPPATKEEL